VADLTAVELDDRFETELLISDPLYFICRRQHPLAGRGVVNPADLRDYPLAGNRVPERFARYLGINPAKEAAAHGYGLFRVKIDVATFAATKRIVLASDSLTLAPLIQVEAELEAGSMAVIRTGQPLPRMNSGLIYLGGRTLTPAALAFVQEARRLKADMEQRAAVLAARFGG